MANLTSSIIFGFRNIDKSMNDNVARTPVAVGQATNAVNEIAKMSKSAQAFLKSIDTSSKTMQTLKAGAKFTADHINPLICAAGAYKVLTSDDKEKEFVNQTSSLGVMFCAEKAYKTIMDYKNIKKAAEALGQTKNLTKLANSSFVKNIADKIGDKRLKTVLNIAYGLGFVAASISGYNLGEKLAKKATTQKQIASEQNQIHQMQKYMTVPAPVYWEEC